MNPETAGDPPEEEQWDPGRSGSGYFINIRIDKNDRAM